MKIQFTIEPSDDTDDYREIYTAQLTLPNNAEVTIRASEDDTSYDGFRADVLEDLLQSLCNSVGLEFEIETDDYALEFELDEERGTILPFPMLAAPVPDLTAEDYGDARADGC